MAAKKDTTFIDPSIAALVMQAEKERIAAQKRVDKEVVAQQKKSATKNAAEVAKAEKEEDRRKLVQAQAGARAQREVFTSIANQFPAGVSGAVRSLGDTFATLSSMGKKSFSFEGLAAGASGVLTSFLQLTDAAFKAAEGQRLLDISAADEARTFGTTNAEAKEHLKNLRHMNTFLADLNPGLVDSVDSFARAHYTTLEDAKALAKIFGQAGMAENLGKSAGQLFDMTKQAADAALQHQSTDLMIKVQQLRGTELGAKKSADGGNLLTEALAKYQRETGKLSISTEKEAAQWAAIVTQLGSTRDIPDVTKMVSPMTALQENTNKILADLGTSIAQLIGPAVAWFAQHSVEIFSPVKNMKDIIKMAVEGPGSIAKYTGPELQAPKGQTEKEKQLIIAQDQMTAAQGSFMEWTTGTYKAQRDAALAAVNAERLAAKQSSALNSPNAYAMFGGADAANNVATITSARVSDAIAKTNEIMSGIITKQKPPTVQIAVNVTGKGLKDGDVEVQHTLTSVGKGG